MMHHRPFWVILALTVVIWFVATMSEHDDYPCNVPIHWTGVDTTRYAITSMDTLLPVSINSNCFQAIRRYFDSPDWHYDLHVQGDTVVRVTPTLLDDVSDQLDLSGIHAITSPAETLTLHVSERRRLAFVPQLRDVHFQFSDQAAIAGVPTIAPDTVWLYGDPASLRHVKDIHTLPATIGNISGCTTVSLALDPVWERYPSLRCSHDSIRVTLPVEHYTEKVITVPVRLTCPDDRLMVNLYPEQVNVTLWVPKAHYDKIQADMVEATTELDPGNPPARLPVHLTRFPASSRVKQVSPSSLQYVIIK